MITVDTRGGGHMRRLAGGCAIAFVVVLSTTTASATDRDVSSGFADAVFSDPTTIDNEWFPLVPGTQFVLEGKANRGSGRLPHRLVFTVTDQTKVIDGVVTRVLWDRDYNAGKLVEEELAFHAQDDDGTVWNLGEYPEEYEKGKFAGAPSTWISGLAGARAGVLMPANPRAGTPSYLQGWAPDIEFADRAKVHTTGRSTCVPSGCYRGVLVVDEWNPYEKGAHELKYYAPGIGNVRVGAAGGKEREVLVLAEVVHLAPDELEQARARVLELDARGAMVSPKLYGKTPRVQTGGETAQ
jgi:hypothetical protein